MSINDSKLGEVGTFYTMIASGPVIVEDREGVLKTLLVKHGDKSLEELKWKFCGGKVLKGETLETTAVRESKEEIGVDVTLLYPLKPMVLWNEHPEGGGEKPQAIMLVHYCATINDEPIKGKEVLAMEWFPLDKLPHDSAPNVALVIKDYLARGVQRGN
ncbi:MAG: NUDIX hydrolase [bacterium]|nr:NUDIX hydrolase [bacterium]